ncbi:acyl-CoA dehydrogenase family protein [Burkholderia multivorans]|uniref:acyl-CoA dehydrogenase family protein n=1 Tax=Burkholderia multivorans TaxID=87883 RepID=UPI000D0091B9|nr:acyl-CoA dehydrogenase family protein [Burkholderia multivorans]MBU9312562.1 acyl-CoA dehydrogenase family protein [Burkholderia multivorans]MCA8250736.1 acyl-CoA dehydrogenase family protein [Burkholderia multivorans]MCA8457309.1 acyl-CoA dehydrogenase family protein [Burkholderia multivorans]MDN7870409.1 acyl-CoA dehydrogenase family protein [Burkholderia multivorans]PRH32877.1 acyl-CoA dehydrogenase [Burkholderia multivorans]
MSWDFETDADFQAELDWIDQFVREEVEPLEHVLGSPWNIHDPAFKALVKPLQQRVKERRLWACHLGPELGGPGYGQVKLALMNEILGRALFAPIVFGCQAPDSGNAEILAHYGTAGQKERFLKPLLAGDIVSCFAMTEPQGGADPKVFTTRAVRDGDAWVINGRKWFASNARYADFFIVMAITDPEVSAYKGMSMFIVPANTPGLSIIRNVGMADEPEATHAYLAFDDVRVPAGQMLGAPGEAFVVAQVRLGGGRVHHAMRTIGLAQKALDALCERALSRHTQGGALADKQMVQEKIADSWLELEQFRLLVMRTAWRIDRYQDYQKVRKDIAAVKAAMPRVLHDIAARALHVHGSIGASSEMPFAGMISRAFQMGLADGPTEVHKVTVAKQLLRDYAPCEQMFPAYHRPTAAAAARRKFAEALDQGAAR